MMAKTKRERHSYFREQTAGFDNNAILIPDNALVLRNNCKEGRWVLGETNYGDRLQLVILKLSKYLHKGNDSIAPGTPIGQIWFVPIAGGVGTDENGDETKLALNLVYYTTLKNSKSGKTGSLQNFGNKAAQLRAQGYDHREILWKPKFVSKSKPVTKASGETEMASWYVLDWSYVLPEDQDDSTYEKIGRIIDILGDKSEMAKLSDPLMLKEHECLDDLSPAQAMQLAASLSAPGAIDSSAPLLNGKALAPSTSG